MEFGQDEISMDEIADITDYIQEEAGATADIIWGYGHNEEIEAGLSVTVIATGFELAENKSEEVITTNSGKTVHTLESAQPQVLTSPLQNAAPKAATPPPAAPAQTALEPFMKPDETQGKIEFNLESAPEAPVQQQSPQALEPFIKKETPEPQAVKPVSTPTPPPTAVTPPPVAPVNNPVPAQPQMEAPKPFIPQPTVAQTPPPTTPPPAQTPPPANASPEQPLQQKGAEQSGRIKDRMSRLRDLSRRLRTSTGLSELEDVPAYQRRQVDLEDVPHSSESQVSRYTLDDSLNEEGKTEIGRNNSFLHDNVD
jgi:cell division protein FtsZ